MKQVSRIFLIMMALVLMVGSAFAAVPGNRAQLDNLPDTPEVPSMTVAKDYSAKNTYHIALSDALESISPVINWKWLPIDMSADGLTGTFTTDGYVAAPGAGTWTSHWTGSWPADYVAAEDCPTVWFYKTMDDNWIEDGTYVDEDGEVWQNYAWHPKQVVRRDVFVIAEDEAEEGEEPETYVECRAWGTCAGTYDMGFAYDGKTKDGYGVRYHKSGKVAQVTKEVTDAEASLFGNDKPTKVTYTWKVLYKTLYLASIVEEYAEGSTAAYFAFNGKTIGVVNK